MRSVGEKLARCADSPLGRCTDPAERRRLPLAIRRTRLRAASMIASIALVRRTVKRFSVSCTVAPALLRGTATAGTKLFASPCPVQSGKLVLARRHARG